MGLDSRIKYFNGNEYSSELSEEIADKFESIKIYGVVGFSINKYPNHYSISFRGKAYNNIITNLTGYSLYIDLNPNELKKMYLNLQSVFKNFYYDIEEIQKAYNDTYNLTDWIEMLTDMYIPPPNEIIGLKEIFKICYENNLQLYACY